MKYFTGAETILSLLQFIHLIYQRCYLDLEGQARLLRWLWSQARYFMWFLFCRLNRAILTFTISSCTLIIQSCMLLVQCLKLKKFFPTELTSSQTLVLWTMPTFTPFPLRHVNEKLHLDGSRSSTQLSFLFYILFCLVPISRLLSEVVLAILYSNLI